MTKLLLFPNFPSLSHERLSLPSQHLLLYHLSKSSVNKNHFQGRTTQVHRDPLLEVNDQILFQIIYQDLMLAKLKLQG